MQGVYKMDKYDFLMTRPCHQTGQKYKMSPSDVLSCLIHFTSTKHF